ncbi:hypothetical protein ACSSWA_11650 [Melioribacter sp. Ez-97]|uniref:hypothetical protein n=1 Tax=Melioribacter sp. Ez-97 TaxID=3423434 RepID=UPI003EDB3DF0
MKKTYPLLMGFILMVSIKAQSVSIEGKSALGFTLGTYLNSEKNSVSAAYNVTASATGFMGSLFYSNWLQENLSIRFSLGFLNGSADVKVDGWNTGQSASSVVPLLMGVNYYFIDENPGKIRPFAGLAAGVYIGSEAKNSIVQTSARSESVFGVKPLAGIDFILGKHFIMGAEAGYNLMTDFKDSVGGRKNYSGGDIAFRFIYLF